MAKLAAALVVWLCLLARSSTAAVAKFERLKVDLFIMSKCPDAVEATATLLPVLQELKGIVSLTMHYVGDKKIDGTYACKHGSMECAGNIQQMCVQQYTKIHRRFDWTYKYIICNFNKGMDNVGTSYTADVCLKEVGVPAAAAQKMLGCMDDPGMDQKLQQNFNDTAAAGVLKSATIQVEGTTICLRDGDMWKDCPGGTDPEDFKQIFCTGFAAKNNGRMPRVCNTAAGRRLLA